MIFAHAKEMHGTRRPHGGGGMVHENLHECSIVRRRRRRLRQPRMPQQREREYMFLAELGS